MRIIPNFRCVKFKYPRFLGREKGERYLDRGIRLVLKLDFVRYEKRSRSKTMNPTTKQISLSSGIAVETSDS